MNTDDRKTEHREGDKESPMKPPVAKRQKMSKKDDGEDQTNKTLTAQDIINVCNNNNVDEKIRDYLVQKFETDDAPMDLLNKFEKEPPRQSQKAPPAPSPFQPKKGASTHATSTKLLKGYKLFCYVINLIDEDKWDAFTLVGVTINQHDTFFSFLGSMTKKAFLHNLSQKKESCVAGATLQLAMGSDIIVFDAREPMSESDVKDNIPPKFLPPASLNEVKMRLDETIPPLAKDEIFIKDFVGVENDVGKFFSMDGNASKSQVLVVAGECGSGKTTFVTRGLRRRYKEFGNMLYCSVTGADLETFPIKSPVINQVREFMQHAAYEIFDAYPTVAHRIFLASSQCAEKQEEWIVKWLDSKLNKRLGNSPTLDSLAIVLDDVGRNNLEFCDVCIRIARQFIGSLIKAKKVKKACIVLCGAGLERVETVRGKKPKGRVGSDPALSRLMVMLKPNLKKLMDDDLREAIEKGLYSKPLSTNARMLMKGVKIVMENELVTQYVYSKQELLDRRIQIAGVAPVMDYATRTHAYLSGLRYLSPEKKKKLVDASFRYLLNASISVAKKANEDWSPEPVHWFHQMLDNKNDDDDEDVQDLIISLGLVTPNPNNTSPALRLLSCEGPGHPVQRGDGTAFELMVSQQVFRMVQSLGYESSRYQLEEAWPRPLTRALEEMPEDKRAHQYKILIDDAASSDAAKKDIAEIWKRLRGGGAVVIRQGNTNAQGADVIICTHDKIPQYGNDGNTRTREGGKPIYHFVISLYLIQCKNQKNLPSAGNAFRTLGVWDKNATRSKRPDNTNPDNAANHKDEKTTGFEIATWDSELQNATFPKCFSALYSHLAIEKFVDMLQKESNQETKVEGLILALSQPMAELMTKGQKERTLFNQQLVKIWPQEALQPAFGAYQPTFAEGSI